METVKPRKQRRNLRSRKTRKLILDSATEIFIAEGYDKTTVEKISSKAGVGYGTIYSHYKGKEDIFNSIVNNNLYDFLKQQKETIETKDLEIVLNHYKELLLFLFKIAVEHRPIFKVYHDAIGKSEKVSVHWDSIIKGLIDDFTASFKEYQEKGLMRDIDVSLAGKSFAVLVNSYFWEIVNEKEDDIETIANTVVDIMFRGLYR